MGKRVCQVSLSDIDNDPRVLRTISALETEGYDVIPVGYGHGLTQTPMTMAHKLKITARQLPSQFLPDGWARRSYWLAAENRKLVDLITRHKPQIIHAHDWNTLPAAVFAAQQVGARLIYDSHEYAVGQRSHQLFWRLVYPAYIRALEGRYIHRADHVITVSGELARLIQRNYQLAATPTVLRSTPHYQKISFKAPDPERLLVHYHGIFTQGRGLCKLIESVAHWPDHFQLRLTGWGQPPRLEVQLRLLAGHHNVSDRINFAARVPHDQLVEHAGEADIGICFWSGDSPQHNYALPNKVFEYTMAGLMLINGPSVELGHFTRQQGHGLCLLDNHPETLGKALSELSVDQISGYKKQALEVAKSLCWEKEKKVLIAIYGDVARG